MGESSPDLTIETVAVSDRPDYVYPERVSCEISERDPSAYRQAADFVNRRGYEVLSVQHEYGIFGGEAGSYLLNLVREVKMPIVTTLHTVLREPSDAQRSVMGELLQLSERIVVMSHKAVDLLVDVHDVCPSKIDVIPHGIPAIDSSAGIDLRAKLGIKGPMILTFGLLSPDKGVQYVIEAMPRILQELPDAVYMIVGATHPSIRASAGEVYRESLTKLSSDLGVSDSVRFVDRFVEPEELVAYLSAMDIYVTPYLKPQQITSGTLAYAVGAGKAVISTPYWYAEEILSDGRGVLVPFRDAEAISSAILDLQANPELRAEMGRKAAEFGKRMLWPEVGRRYAAAFAKAKHDSAERLREAVQKEAPMSASGPATSTIRLVHLLELSDDTGILQHANYTIPNRAEGYCVDDNARALLLTGLLEDDRPLTSEVSLLQSRYLSFVQDAYNPQTGRFRNFMSYDRSWLEQSGSEDSHGRTMWGLGVTVHRCRNQGRCEVAKSLFLKAAPALYATTSPRTWAYAVLAADEFLQVYPHEYSVQSLMQTMANRLWRQYEINRCEDWLWFEQSLAYANARLPQALITAGASFGNHTMLEIGLKSLTWLMRLQTGPKGVFAPIGTEGFFDHFGTRAYYDQQPIEAWASVSACLAAARIDDREVWSNRALSAFRWFLGENMLNSALADESTGGCKDGLHADRPNENQGAESTLSFLCASAEMRLANLAPKAVATRRRTGEFR